MCKMQKMDAEAGLPCDLALALHEPQQSGADLTSREVNGKQNTRDTGTYRSSGNLHQGRLDDPG
jgi:hypothetical protein